MNAKIQWKTIDEGGRRSPPTGDSATYAPTVRFMDEPWPPKVAWSLVVMKLSESNFNYDWVADVHFLVPEAPHDSLIPGCEFELYEGGKCVASGTVVD